MLKAELVEGGGSVQGFDSSLVSIKVKIKNVKINDGKVEFDLAIFGFDKKKSSLGIFDVVSLFP
jgi:hypothetical protein